MYVCPICKQEFETLMLLKIHFKRHNISYCPYCKRYFKNSLEHFARKGDDRHLVLYYLSTNLYKNHASNTKLLKKALDVTKKLVRKDEGN